MGCLRGFSLICFPQFSAVSWSHQECSKRPENEKKYLDKRLDTCRLCRCASTYARREQEKCEKTGGNDGNPRCSPQLLGSRIDPENAET
jgi:hypothetical protein